MLQGFLYHGNYVVHIYCCDMLYDLIFNLSLNLLCPLLAYLNNGGLLVFFGLFSSIHHTS